MRVEEVSNPRVELALDSRDRQFGEQGRMSKQITLMTSKYVGSANSGLQYYNQMEHENVFWGISWGAPSTFVLRAVAPSATHSATLSLRLWDHQS